MLLLLTRNLLLVFIAWLMLSTAAFADTTVSLFDSYAGNINFVGAESTRRTQANNGGTGACNVLAPNTNNTAQVSGIPTGATIRAAHLYWAGSGATPDYNVTFEGGNITAAVNRQYTADFVLNNTTTFDFFSGVADVTAQVNAKRNGTYNFSGLTVNTGAPFCAVEGVLAGWSLIIVYEDASEDFRVVNLYEGYQTFRESSITLIADNFRVPAVVNGKYATLTWEGDDTLNNNGENLVLNGTSLTDGDNPVGQQFNSKSNIASISPSTGAVNADSYGVDLDAFAIDSSILSPGSTSATAVYSSGTDLVLLSMQILSITNTAVSDLSITKTATSTFVAGTDATYNLVVNNAGPNIEPGNIVVTDTLPAGLSFVSASGTGWSCGAVGQNVTCTRTGNLAVGANTSNITLTVAVAPTAPASISNTASVSGTNFDNQGSNDDSTATVTLSTGPIISLQKTTETLSDPINGTTNPKSIPGALAEYTISASNSGATPTDNNTIIITDAIPLNTSLFVNDISGAGTGPIRFVDGTPPSGLNYNYSSLASATDNLSFSNDNGATFNYVPSADAEGLDSNVTNIRVSTLGQFLATSPSGDPSFSVLFRVKVQ